MIRKTFFTNHWKFVTLICMYLIAFLACSTFTNSNENPTLEMLQPTYTPLPTYTPFPTPTTYVDGGNSDTQDELDFNAYSSLDVIQVFEKSGLEVGEYRPMTKDDYGIAPYVAVEGTRFFIPSLCIDCGGRILSFDTPEDLQLVKEYFVSLGESSAIFFSWVFEYKNILIQINGDLPEDQAISYEETLLSLE